MKYYEKYEDLDVKQKPGILDVVSNCCIMWIARVNGVGIHLREACKE